MGGFKLGETYKTTGGDSVVIVRLYKYPIKGKFLDGPEKGILKNWCANGFFGENGNCFYDLIENETKGPFECIFCNNEGVLSQFLYLKSGHYVCPACYGREMLKRQQRGAVTYELGVLSKSVREVIETEKKNGPLVIPF